MAKTFAVAVIPDQELTAGSLYVTLDGREKPVGDLHPDDALYASREASVVLRQHPDAYFRPRVKPENVWRTPAEDVRKSLEGFLGQRWPALYAPGVGGSGLTTWGWIAFIGSALNAVGLLFFPLADSSTVATLRGLGGQTTALTRLLAARWFSPLLALLTAACLAQALRAPARRKLWVTVSYLPAVIGFVAAMLVFYSAYFSILDSIK